MCNFRSFQVLCIFFGGALSAAEFSTQIVDGLGLPISGAHATISCMRDGEDISEITLESARDGTVRFAYDPARCALSGISLGKDGYQGYFKGGMRTRYTLRRNLDPAELPRIAQLGGDRKLEGLREILATSYSRDLADPVFHYEGRLRPGLRILASDANVAERARELLAMIGVSEDLHLILGPPPKEDPDTKGRWRYLVVTALVRPDSEDEWSFLSDSACGAFDDRWVDAGAIQTLKLTASPRSEMVLEEARRKNRARRRLVEDALNYIHAKPAPLEDANLSALAERAAKAVGVGGWQGNGAPRFNEGGDKALVDFIFDDGQDRLTYTATFHRVEGTWIFRGARETLQQFSVAGLIAPRK